MKIFTSSELTCAQGDLRLVRLREMPPGVREVPPANGQHIIAHSETGHHHTVLAEGVRVYQGADPMICYLVSELGAFDLLHSRPDHQHEGYRVECAPGEVIARVRQREWSPWGDRMVQD